MRTFDRHQRAKVVARALATVGGRYVLGGNKTHATDCSGDVKMSWAEVGLELPHNADQQAHDPHVRYVTAKPGMGGVAQRLLLRPGDLAFYYGDIHKRGSIEHVAMFGGRNAKTNMNQLWIINATNEHKGIEKIFMDRYARPCGYGYVGH